MRLLLASVLISSGLFKAMDPVGTAIKVGEYQSIVFGLSSPEVHSTAGTIASILIATEFILGIAILVGIYRRLTLRLTLGLMLGMTLLTGYMYLTNITIDCGCFGDVIKLSTFATFVKNLALLPLTYILMLRARRLRHLYYRRERWIPAVLAISGIIYFIYESYNDLPAVDFLPYRVGYNLPERIQQADAELEAAISSMTEYLYTKGGDVQTFTIDNLPDSTWSFVKMIQAPEAQHLAPKYDLHLLTPSGEEVTDELLANETGVLLLLSPSWSRASQHNIDVINEIYRYAQSEGLAFYCVSPSHAEEEAYWRYQTGAIYPSLFMDATTLKMMTRSNPGLVLLRSGVIMDKVPPSRLPEIEDIPAFVSSRLSGKAHTSPLKSRWILIIALGVFVSYAMVRRLSRRLRVVSYLSGKTSRETNQK